MFDLNISPDQIAGYLFNIADPQKLLQGVFQSSKGKQFIAQRLGKDPDDLKMRLMDAFIGAKESQAQLAIKKKQTEAETVQAYKVLAGQLISVDRLSQFDAVVLSAGLFGIDSQRIAQYLRSKGWDATSRIVQNYYNKRQSWFKRLLASKGKVIPGWNDFDLAPTMQGKQADKKLKPCPSPEQDQVKVDNKADVTPVLKQQTQTKQPQKGEKQHELLK